jgi:hypothetical protein
MSANQNHGFLFEDAVIRSVTGYSKFDYQYLLPNGYTSKMDIVKDIHSDRNFSIKVAGRGNSIGCGDALRFYDQCANEEFIMVIGIWDQITDDIKRYQEIHEISFSPANFHEIWGDIKRQDLDEFVRYVKSIPKGRDAQLKSRDKWKIKKDQLCGSSCGHIIKINPKIDSKSQRRVQCTLDMSRLTHIGLPHIIYETDYRGIGLPYEQESTPRYF